MNQPFTLYYTPGTCAQAVRIALEEAGATYDLRRVDFASQQQRSPDYLAVNPKGRVPALVTEQGTLTEAPALLAYIAQYFADAKLAPTDLFGFARMQEFNSYLSSTVHINHAHRPRAARWADDADAQAAMQRKVPGNMTENFQYIEDHYLKGPWVLGEEYSVCDGYLFTVAGWLKGDSVDIAQFKNVNDHFQRMKERAAVQRALA